MIEIDRYMDDGANWQAQCVLAYIRSHFTDAIFETWNKEYFKYDANVGVGRLENCREQGYVITLSYKCVNTNYWVYEHRNSDNICIKKFDGQFINTPTINDVPMRDKWDYDANFEYGKIIDASEYILNDMKEKISKIVE